MEGNMTERNQTAFACFSIWRRLLPAAPASLRHHHLDKFLVIDLTIAVDVCLADHLVDLFVRELLAEVRHDVAQLRCADESVAIAIEDFERLDELLLPVRVLYL